MHLYFTNVIIRFKYGEIYLHIFIYFKEYLSWTENDSIENHLVNHLIRTIGTEIDIRKRQLLFILHDKLYSTNDKKLTQISSGSLAEGLDLPGSDLDVMFVDDMD